MMDLYYTVLGHNPTFVMSTEVLEERSDEEDVAETSS